MTSRGDAPLSSSKTLRIHRFREPACNPALPPSELVPQEPQGKWKRAITTTTQRSGIGHRSDQVALQSLGRRLTQAGSGMPLGHVAARYPKGAPGRIDTRECHLTVMFCGRGTECGAALWSSGFCGVPELGRHGYSGGAGA